MRIILLPFRIIYVIYAFLLFLVLMVPVFVFALALSSFGNIRGGNAIYRACMVWGDIWFFMTGLRHQNIYEHPLPEETASIFVSNHISFLDSPIIFKTFRRPVRALGTIEYSKIPVFGFIYRKTIVTVDRSSPANRTKSVQVLKSVLRRGISILVFPEGTFNTTGQPIKQFYDGAFRIAIETGAPIVPVLMLDSYDRMHYNSIFSLNPGRCRTVFLQPIATDQYSLDEVVKLRKLVHQRMTEKLISYGASWITGGKEHPQELAP